MKARDWECSCGFKWTAPVVYAPYTANLSGEITQFCPKCSSRPVMGSAHWVPLNWDDAVREHYGLDRDPTVAEIVQEVVNINRKRASGTLCDKALELAARMELL